MEGKLGTTTVKAETRKEGFDLGSKCPPKGLRRLKEPFCRMWLGRGV